MPGVAVSGTVYTVTTTITDNDVATWSLTGPAGVSEGATATYTLALAGTLQAGGDGLGGPGGELPGCRSEQRRAAEAADFVSAFLDDVDSAITAYNGSHSGTFARSGNTLTYTQGRRRRDGRSLSMTIDLATEDDSLVEGPEDYALSITAAAVPSTTGAGVAVSGTVYTVTTTIHGQRRGDVVADRSGGRVGRGRRPRTRWRWPVRCRPGETASVDLAVSFPGAGPSNDAAEAADFVSAFLDDVDSAITAYNGSHSGTFARSGNTLTLHPGRRRRDGRLDDHRSGHRGRQPGGRPGRLRALDHRGGRAEHDGCRAWRVSGTVYTVTDDDHGQRDVADVVADRSGGRVGRGDGHVHAGVGRYVAGRGDGLGGPGGELPGCRSEQRRGGGGGLRQRLPGRRRFGDHGLQRQPLGGPSPARATR